MSDAEREVEFLNAVREIYIKFNKGFIPTSEDTLMVVDLDCPELPEQGRPLYYLNGAQ